MGSHNKQRKRGIKYHVVNLRVNDTEWQFLQELKEKGISMSEYIRTTMKTTPRYQEFIKLLYGKERDTELKSRPAPNTAPSLPTQKWNSIEIEKKLARKANDADGLRIYDENFFPESDIQCSAKSNTPLREGDKYTGELVVCPVCIGDGSVNDEYCRRCRGTGYIRVNDTYTDREGTRSTGNGIGSDGLFDKLVSVVNGKIDTRYE